MKQTTYLATLPNPNLKTTEYDALFEPGHASQIWRNGVPLPALDAHRVWRAHKKGETVAFQAQPE